MPSIFLKCHSYKSYFLGIQHFSLQNYALTLSLCKSGHWGLGPHILLDRSCRKNALPLWELKKPAKSNWSQGGTERQHQNPPKTTHLETVDRIEQNRKEMFFVMTLEPLQRRAKCHHRCCASNEIFFKEQFNSLGNKLTLQDELKKTKPLLFKLP